MTAALQIAPSLEETNHPKARRRKAQLADLFCGAGGFSIGALRALRKLNIEMDLVAVNHWNVATDTIQKNFPKAKVLCQDLQSVRPLEAVPGGRLDLLTASPTCTFHSRARGGRPTSDQQRQDPEHVIGWLTQLRVDRLLVENVPEFVDWGPVSTRTGRPIKAKKGLYFQAWVQHLQAIGYQVAWGVLNCADYGVATTRERFFLVARRDGKAPKLPLPTHSRDAAVGTLALPGMALRKWKGARESINWKKKGRSIFGRNKPLSLKSVTRIAAGAVKFEWPWPYLVRLADHIRTHPQTRDASTPEPIIVTKAKGKGKNRKEYSRPETDKETTRRRKHWAQTLKLLAECDRRIAAAGQILPPQPFVVMQRTGSSARGVDQSPIPTVTPAGMGSLAVVNPVVPDPNLVVFRNNADARSLEEPAPAILAAGQHLGLAEPIVVRTDMHQSNAGCVYPADEPLRTVTTANGIGMAEPIAPSPIVLGQQSGSVARTVDEPLPTIATDGAQAVVQPLIAPFYGEGSGQTCKSVESPLDAVTTHDRFGLVVPLTHTSGGASGASSTEKPLRTITTAKGGELAIVMPVTHGDDSDRTRSPDEPLHTVTGAHRGELAFISASFGEREGQTPRVHSIDEPTPTIPAKGSIRLVHGVNVNGYDILFRMLEPRELSHASSFDDEEQYLFTGTKTDQVKQIGNAVPPAMAEALVRALFSEN